MSRVEAMASRPDRCGPQLGSCCGPMACRLCCRCCPPTKESTSTKLIYALVLVLTTALMISLLFPSLQQKLQTFFRDFNATCIDLKVGGNCMKLTGYMAIYKVSFSVGIFFVSMCLMTFGVTSSRGLRAAIHNGFWFFKILTMATLVVAIFVIPISHLDQMHTGWIYASLAGNCLFILIQMICLIDSSASVCAALERLSNRSKLWKIAEVMLAILLLSLWLTMAIVVFISHGRQEYCLTKHLVIIFNTGFCITLVLAALTPCARTPATCMGHNGQIPTYAGRLVQVGAVIVYITYWIWSAMTSSPESPGIVELSTFLLDEDDLACRAHNTEITETGLLCAATFMMFITLGYISTEAIKSKKKNLDINRDQTFCGCNQGVILGRVNNHGCDSVLTPLSAPPPLLISSLESKGGQKLLRNEYQNSSYNYSLFHFTMALAIMFLTSQLTRWFQPHDYKSLDLDKSWSTVGLKICCAWGCGLFYLIYILWPDRCCHLPFKAPSTLKSLRRGMASTPDNPDNTMSTNLPSDHEVGRLVGHNVMGQASSHM